MNGTEQVKKKFYKVTSRYPRVFVKAKNFDDLFLGDAIPRPVYLTKLAKPYDLTDSAEYLDRGVSSLYTSVSSFFTNSMRSKVKI